MMTKRLLVPERRRPIPGQFSWVHQQLVRGQHLCRKDPRQFGIGLLRPAHDVPDPALYGPVADQTPGRVEGESAAGRRIASAMDFMKSSRQGTWRLRDVRALLEAKEIQTQIPFDEHHPLIRNLSEYGLFIRAQTQNLL